MAPATFYVLAAIAIVATTLCITEKHAVHAIIYLVTSFFSLAMIFFLLGAPLVAMFEVIIYAGAIMVLFLFIIMMIRTAPEREGGPRWHDWLPALFLGAVIAGSAGMLGFTGSGGPAGHSIDLKEFATTLFQRYGLAVEIVSMQLLFALVGALYLGRRR